MFHRVLVPVDGSALCAPAIAQVPQLVDADGEVVIIEVIDSASRILAQTTPAGFAWYDSGLSSELIAEVISAQRAAADEHLAAARSSLEAAGLTKIESRVLEGIPGPAIVELAHKISADVVVMATHGRSGLKRTMLGSVADHVVRHLHGIPVLLLHPDDGQSATAAVGSATATGR